MPRLPDMRSRHEVPETARPAFDEIAGNRKGSVSGPFGVMLHSPDLAVRGSALSNYLRWHSDLTPRQREIAILTTARHFDAAVMWVGHVRLAREAGVGDEVIDAIAARESIDGLAGEHAPEDAAVIRYVRELWGTNRVSALTFEALHGRLGDRGIVDLTGLVGYYAFVAATLNAFEIEPADVAGARRLP
jgi:4-carboxymuconolactone decarboxylase